MGRMCKGSADTEKCRKEEEENGRERCHRNRGWSSSDCCCLGADFPVKIQGGPAVVY